MSVPDEISVQLSQSDKSKILSVSSPSYLNHITIKTAMASLGNIEIAVQSMDDKRAQERKKACDDEVRTRTFTMKRFHFS
jgi:hypothetical protein